MTDWLISATLKLGGPVTICINNHAIVAVEVVRNLGLYIDQHMKLNSHVNKVVCTIFATSQRSAST